MGRKKPESRISASATAKVEAVAKASYQRRKTITEVVPPDVSRAKAGAWLTLLSPITEWAGLEGDALKFKRQLLRIQQEETLVRVAHEVRARLADSPTTRVVPRKILVPALEKASLEEVSDDVMIDRWANLLASAAEDVKVQPRFIGILDELAGSQAVCLERVAFNRSERTSFPSTNFADSFLDFAEHNVREFFRLHVSSKVINKKRADNLLDRLVDAFNTPGVLLGNIFVDWGGNDSGATYDAVSETPHS